MFISSHFACATSTGEKGVYSTSCFCLGFLSKPRGNGLELTIWDASRLRDHPSPKSSWLEVQHQGSS